MRPPRLGGVFGGAVWVALGYTVLGGAGYAFLALAARRLPDRADFTALSSLYLLVNILGPGLFAAVEQETSRTVSGRSALGLGTRPVVARLAVFSAVLAGGIAVVLLALSPLLVDRVLARHWSLLLGLFGAAVGYAVVAVVRGTFAGRQAFGLYGASVGAEGLTRLVPALVLAAAGVTAAAPYGLVFCLAPVVALLVTVRWFTPGAAGPPEPAAPLARSVSLLTVAWGLSLALANAGPVVVNGLLPDGSADAAAFAAAVVLARVPLFVFQGAQALVLPTFSRAAARGDRAALRRAVRPALVLVVVLGVPAVALGGLAGEPAARLAFGSRFVVPSALVAALLAGTVVLMAVQILQPALLALRRHRLVSVAWVLGAAVFVGAFALPWEPVTDALVAQLASAAVTAAILAVGLTRTLRRDPAPASDEGTTGVRVSTLPRTEDGIADG